MVPRLVGLRHALVALALFACGALFAPRVRADEIAPELETLALERAATSELRRIDKGLGHEERQKLVGAYVAFDPTTRDALAMAACDDDGDPVVVVSDGMLRLVSDVARAASYDEANGTHRVEEYATFFARSQLPGRRLLPPPAGFHTVETPTETHDDRLREALAFLIARELAHLAAGDLVCPHPTPTRERGDDVWTADEQSAARQAARRVYPGRAAERDLAAAARMGRGREGALAFLRFFAALEAEKPRVSTSYLETHPEAARRLATLKNATTELDENGWSTAGKSR